MKSSSSKKRIIINLIFILILLLPILLYSFKFGFGIWGNHSEWAEMGNAIGGIYSPILAFFTLLVLAYQTSFQAKADEYNYDITYIQDNKREFDSYIDKLELALEKPVDGHHTVRDFLHKQVEQLGPDELKSELSLK
ncbi:hypothetical protein [uncultured Tolumonas sp.]|uniref:hypothetical protein n=1 Tax=uncultured Tolumonas sp. TaxID=263765 RepID=UPI00292CEE12|nr:hypothetical protein [uncultured Tolumonas sp.]